MKTICLMLLLAAPLKVSAQLGSSLEPFLGTWSGVFTTQDNEYWNVEDLNCFGGCGRDGYEYLASLLDDPANDDRSVAELMGEASAFTAESFSAILTPRAKLIQQENTFENDPKLHCQPYGFVRQVSNPLPIRIRRLGDHLLFEYEEWSLLRTVYMDDRDHPEYRSPSMLGHAVGRVENGTLIIETARVTADRISDATQAGHSDQLTGVERYTVHDNPRRLELELTVEDPVTFTEPYVVTKTWLSTPDVELLQDSCGDLPGVH
jgi:hypothetical protein